jgi:hypothetical protein
MAVGEVVTGFVTAVIAPVFVAFNLSHSLKKDSVHE